MRKFFSCLTVLAFFVLTGAFLWSQRGSFFDFFSDFQRQTSAPPAVTFSEVNSPPAEITGNTEGTEITTETPSVETNVPVEIVPDLESDVSQPNNDTTEVSPELSNLPVVSTFSDSDLPTEFNLAVPFTSQAPTSNWDMVHEETCEEAALYMVDEFYKGTPAGQISTATAEENLMKIVEFEKALFGFFESTTATQIAVLAEQMYGYEKVEVISGPTIDDLKKQLVAGHPVIVPTAGRLLGNPNFTGEGPLYHALVLKGYTETTFVTNDPGTRHGADYQYDFAVVMEATHDWNGGDVLNGAKVVVVIYPNE